MKFDVFGRCALLLPACLLPVFSSSIGQEVNLRTEPHHILSEMFAASLERGYFIPYFV